MSALVSVHPFSPRAQVLHIGEIVVKQRGDTDNTDPESTVPPTLSTHVILTVLKAGGWRDFIRDFCGKDSILSISFEEQNHCFIQIRTFFTFQTMSETPFLPAFKFESVQSKRMKA